MTEKQEFINEPYGINQTKRLTIPSAEEILYRPFKCLDHGFVRLVDYMGGDDSIVQAARISYGKGTTKKSDDRGLIRFLMRHEHTTPFEMVELKFHARLPIFVAREWIRHRTANVNEYSGRYSILNNEFYIPEPEVMGQPQTKNRQGRGEPINHEQAVIIMSLLKQHSLNSHSHYTWMLNEDPQNKGHPLDKNRDMLARELTRLGLTLNFYTEWYWKIDLHNLFHFLKLRMDERAMHEIRVYANTMAQITKRVAPVAYEAFEDHKLKSVRFSRLEIQVLSDLIRHGSCESEVATLASLINDNKGKEVEYNGVTWKIGKDGTGELSELLEKLQSLNIPNMS